jgi:hypothetical protein
MKTYIGDSVYLRIEPDGLTLTTENGLATDPSNIIFLDWAVFENLTDTVKVVLEEHKKHSAKPPADDKPDE